MSPLWAVTAGPRVGLSDGGDPGGVVSLERPYFYCLKCKHGFYPLNEALDLGERRKQWDIQEAEAKLAAEVSFETAQELFSQLAGLSLSDHTTYKYSALNFLNSYHGENYIGCVGIYVGSTLALV